jgi:hypothetical protein
MNDLLVYRNLDVSRDRHMNDPLDDLTMDVSRVNRNYVRRDLSLDALTDGSHDHRRSDRVDDHLKDGKKSHRVDLSIDPECYVLVGHHTNVTDDRNDLNLDVSRGLRMSDLLGDQNSDVMTDANRGNRNCVLHDPRMGGTTDGNRDRRMSDPLDAHRDLNLVVMTDVSRGLRMNGTDDRNDLKTDGKKDAMNRRVMCY